MFLFAKGKSSGFKEIADEHFEGLKAVWNQASGKNTFYAQSIILRAEKHAKGKSKTSNFFKDLIADEFALLKRLIIGECDVLLKEIKEFEKKQALKRYPTVWRKNKKDEKVLTAFGKLIQDVFDYDEFVKKTSKWNAYDLTEKLDIKVCAYCNRNYTFTITFPSKLVRPELDHFLPKSVYPFLALSFYNLVPSCHTCNSNLKHSKSFDHENYIHPYISSIDTGIKFSLRLKHKLDKSLADSKDSFGLGFFYGDPNSFEVVVKSRKTDVSKDIDGKFNSEYFRRALNNINTFRIRELYNQHKDIITEIIMTSIHYNDDYIDNLYETYKGTLFRSREDVLRFVTRNYTTLEEMPNRAFSKLTKDVFEELGLKY